MLGSHRSSGCSRKEMVMFEVKRAVLGIRMRGSVAPDVTFSILTCMCVVAQNDQGVVTGIGCCADENAATARAAPSHRTGAMQPTQRRVLSAVTLLLLTLGGRLAGAQTTVRVSVASDGTEGNDVSMGSALSADGRFVAFDSAATDLVAGDTNRVSDVFVHDRQTGTTERVSVASDGAQGNGSSGLLSFAFPPALSADGRFVAFVSFATNLVASDTNGATDVFVHDRQTGITERVSVASDGTEGNAASAGAALSADGRFVAFHSTATNLVAGDTNGKTDVFIHDRQTGITERVSVASGGTEGNGFSAEPALSADGRFVAFHNTATNLVAGDTNGKTDVFVHDRQTGTTERVSVA